MYCRECGEKYLNDKAVICVKCGVERDNGRNYCPECGESIPNPKAEVCLKCGISLKKTSNLPVQASKPKEKLIAGLLALFLGYLGIHRFYLGYNTIGIIQLVLFIGGFLTCGLTWIISGIWAIVDCIMIFMGKVPDFYGQELL